MADRHKALAAFLILGVGAAYAGYNLIPHRTPATEKPDKGQAADTSVGPDGGQCTGILKLVERGMNNTITLVDDYGADCTIWLA
jgi:hypothetical protein